jgi:type IV pilus assembly protein PilE
MHCVPRTGAASRGFTLIELLVVMAIVALLSMVAYPSYARHVARAQRAEATVALLEAAHFMERYYATASTYIGATLPDRLKHVPPSADDASARFTLSVGSSTATGYTLTATPLRADDCGTLLLSNSGVRTRTGTGLSNDECWR